MEQVSKDTKISGRSRGLANLKPFKKGQSGNPKGHKLGQRNFKTIYREALIKIANLNNVTPESLEDDMIAQAVAAARKGDIGFYKDVMDRIHGKAVQPIEGDVNIKVSKLEEIQKATKDILNEKD